MVPDNLVPAMNRWASLGCPYGAGPMPAARCGQHKMSYRSQILLGSFRRMPRAACPPVSSRWHRLQAAGGAYLWVLVTLLAAPAAALAQDEPTSEPVASGTPTEITLTDRGTVRIHVADLALSTVLHLLSLEGHRNIISSPKVKGRVTANLYEVTFEEALEAILVTNGAGYRVVGNFIYVYTNEELAEI